MNSMNLSIQIRRAVLVALFLSLGSSIPSLTAAAPPSSANRERELIQVLQSDAPRSEKAITCKFLAIYGSKAAVPVLAPLLADAELNSWARIALEAITDPAADDALRAALDQVQGRMLVGVINSISVRRDPKAVPPLIQKLKSSDVAVASAAAVALGQIGGDQAAQALVPALSNGSVELRSATAKGCILCAEGYLAAGQTAQAMKLYDTVRAATLPKQRILEATRGAILARQLDGIPLLLEQLRATDPELVGIGLRTARELPGRPVTEALAAELNRTTRGPAGAVAPGVVGSHRRRGVARRAEVGSIRPRRPPHRRHRRPRSHGQRLLCAGLARSRHRGQRATRSRRQNGHRPN